jgi:hydroxyacylglutathione hydrolase
MPVIAENDSFRIVKMELGQWATNCYVVVARETGESLLIDAPDGPDVILEALEGTRPRRILLTHGHFDHTGALESLRALLRVPLAAHRADSAWLARPPDVFLEDGENIPLGELMIEVRHTPGHTPGSLCFRIAGYLFGGDTVFPGGPGHTDTPDDFKEILASITRRIFTLPEETIILPGHGPETTVGQAKAEYAVFAARHRGDGMFGDVTWES